MTVLSFFNAVSEAPGIWKHLEGTRTMQDVTRDLAHQVGREEAVKQKFSFLFPPDPEEEE